MNAPLPHLMIVPIVLPLLTAALMLPLGEKRVRWKGLLNLASTLAGLLVAIELMFQVDAQGGAQAMGVYLPSNWDVPFGIVLAVDRLSALMLVLTGLVATGAVLFSLGRWDRAGVHFHALFQIQLMGINGAFLTGDLFNLFVFFEVMLAASYGLLLHGSGRARVGSGLHYIAVNLAASSLFLVGVSLIYGVTGTLNMADLAQKIPHVAPADRGLLHAGAAILAVAFLTKAAMWPLNFWLAPAYSAASAPVAGLFAVMTKVGIYTVLRLWTLLFSAQAGASAFFGGDALVYGGLATLAFGAIGVLASQRLARLASFSIVVSSGSLLAAIGFGQVALTGGALFYLLSSTLALSAFFLLVELVERSRQPEKEDEDEYADDVALPLANFRAAQGVNLDDDEKAIIGEVIPAAMAFLGLAFIACTMLIAGVPPLSGFVGKFVMLSALLNPFGVGASFDPPQGEGWALLVLVIVSGLFALIALTRSGIRYFWASHDASVPQLRVLECLPVALLLAACVALTVRAEPAMRYLGATPESLHAPEQYIGAVLSAQRLPSPTQSQGAGAAP